MAAGAIVVLGGGGDDEPTLATFCDRSRSADAATDRASAYLLTPEADPEEVERLFATATDGDGRRGRRQRSRRSGRRPRMCNTVYVRQAEVLAEHDWSLAGAAVEMFAIAQ